MPQAYCFFKAKLGASVVINAPLRASLAAWQKLLAATRPYCEGDIAVAKPSRQPWWCLVDVLAGASA